MLPAESADAVGHVQAIFAQAAADAQSGDLPLARRLEAVGLLAHAPSDPAVAALLRLLTDETLPELRLAAVRASARHDADQITAALLRNWSEHTPALRQEVVQNLLQSPARIAALLDEIEAQRIPAASLDSLAVRRLTGSGPPALRQRARQLLAAAAPAERKQVLAAYRAALEIPGNPLRGREGFRKHCAACHRMEGFGHVVGPDISDTRTKTAEALLQDILHPNAAIDANYINYLVSTTDGRVLNGLIVAETASSITLRRAENQSDSDLRADIESVRSTNQSLMPEGMEKQFTIEQMADLLSYLKNWRYLDGAVPVPAEAK